MIIREADDTDKMDLLAWRNDPLTRHASIQSDVVTVRQHLDWFRHAQTDPFITLYIGTIENEKVGCCRFNVQLDLREATVSITTNPSIRGKGWGSLLLSTAIEQFYIRHQITLLATIKQTNGASVTIFKRNGFILVSEDSDFYYFKKEYPPNII